MVNNEYNGNFYFNKIFYLFIIVDNQDIFSMHAKIKLASFANYIVY